MLVRGQLQIEGQLFNVVLFGRQSGIYLKGKEAVVMVYKYANFSG